MRRIANLHADEAKTDARDTAVIAGAARSMPRILRSLRLADDQLAERGFAANLLQGSIHTIKRLSQLTCLA